MKSLKDYSLNLSEQEYHDFPAWSYSLIARYAREGFSAISTLHDKKSPTPAMQFGSLFDSIVTRGSATLKEYGVVDVAIPDAERKALEYICASANKSYSRLEDIPSEDIMAMCDACQYQSRWGYDARIKHLSPYSGYYDILCTGRKPISAADWNDAMSMAEALRSNECTKKLFGTKNTKDKEYLYQIQFILNTTTPAGRKVKVKCMFDLLVIDHAQKTIQPVDLKTSSMPAFLFSDNFLTFRYDIQAAIYTHIITSVKNALEEYREYVVLPFLFADISRSDKQPVTYEYDPCSYNQANGLSYETRGKTYKYKPWDVLLDEILGYEETNATVPSHIKTDEPNNIIELLNR